MSGRKNKKHRLAVSLTGICILLILAGGLWTAWRVDTVMQAGTHSEEPLAQFSMQDGDVRFSLFGYSGTIPLRSAAALLEESVTSLPSPQRLLLWGIGAVGDLWKNTVLPFAETVYSRLPLPQ